MVVACAGYICVFFMNILLIGNGGREHALAWKIKQSSLCENLFIAPGNAGTAMVGQNVPIGVEDFNAIGDFSFDKKIDLLVIGPEGPLVKGLRDYFENDERLAHILIVGPGKIGAQLEGSKDFSKQFMLRNNIPTAKAQTFQASDLNKSLHYVAQLTPPIVLKADGLAAGKGVVIAQSVDEAQQTLREMLEAKKFGDAGSKVLIEEFLDGIELSVFVLTDGRDYVILPEAKDYKRIGGNDTGPNTGGMGSVSPVAFADAAFMKKVEDRIIKPTIDGLSKENIPYKGFIFFGLIKVKGEPMVIEYNARMGDPETQSVMLRLQSDLVELLVATANGELSTKKVFINPQHAVTVCLVSGGYPGDYEKGKIISGLETSGPLVFHAGTKQSEGNVQTDGGRVLAVTALGNNLEMARKTAYSRVSQLSWEGVYFRKDIGVDLLNLTPDLSPKESSAHG
jgi:phosphoribosylamine--glycine ligase